MLFLFLGLVVMGRHNAKLSPVCPAKRNANLWIVILCNELMANKFDLIWFDLMNKFCIRQGWVVTFSDTVGKFTITVTVPFFWDNANNQKYILAVLLKMTFFGFPKVKCLQLTGDVMSSQNFIHQIPSYRSIFDRVYKKVYRIFGTQCMMTMTMTMTIMVIIVMIMMIQNTSKSRQHPVLQCKVPSHAVTCCWRYWPRR